MTKREKITRLLSEAGFETTSDFRIVNGPKAKLDILECWNVDALHNGLSVEIYSAYTMTHLVAAGLVVKKNTPETCLYGGYVAVPKPKPDLITVERKTFLDLIAAAQMAKIWFNDRQPRNDEFAENVRQALYNALPPAIANNPFPSRED